MHKVLSIFVLMSFFIHLFYTSGYLLDYYVNTDFYLENCENKDRPELHCDGQCVLAQKMKGALPAPDEHAVVSVPQNVEFVQPVFCFIPVSGPQSVDHIFRWGSMYEFLLATSLFRPPSIG